MTAVYIRLAAALVALAAGVAAVLVVAELLHNTPGPVSTSSAAPAPAASSATSASAPSTPAFPAPPNGAVVFSQEVGSDAVALAVTPGARLRLQASVVGPDGSGVSGLHVSFVVAGRTLAAGACGAGCYHARSDSSRPSASIAVHLSQRTVVFELPTQWPPASGAAIVARAARVWRGLQTLVSHERLASSPTNALYTVYRFQAPDRLSYTIRGRSAAVVIGGTRWDRSAPGARWQRSSQTPPLQQPVPFWASAVDAHVVDTGTLRGRPVWRVSFFDPRSSAWFLVALDRQSYRTLDVRMTAASHFMHDAYGPFDAPFRITSPTAGGSS